MEPIGIAVERSETFRARSARTTDDLLVANHGAWVTKTDNQAEFPRQTATICRPSNQVKRQKDGFNRQYNRQ